MRRLTALVAVLVLSCPAAAREEPGEPPAPKDWAKALRNGDEDALRRLWDEAGPDERDLLREGFRHREPHVRMMAAWRAADLEARWAVDTLRELSGDRHPGVAVAARLALERLGLGGGDRPWRSLVYPGADLDKTVHAGGATEWTLLSKDGTRTVAGYYRRALAELGWDRLRDLSGDEMPANCRGPWAGLYGSGPVTFGVSVCGAAAPGGQAVVRLRVRDAFAPRVMGKALERELKEPGVR